jgi:subtilisin family serine protease/subtilase family serine protease
MLAALALLLSIPVNAGIFGDLSMMGSAFPKKWRDSKEGEMLVKFKASVPTATRDAKHVQEGNTKLRELKRSGIHQVRISPDQTIDGAIARYLADSNVEFAEPNYTVRAMRTPNEPAFNLLWGLDNTGQTLGTAGADIKAPLAWDLATGSADVVVMVIDSGLDYDHQDFTTTGVITPEGIITGPNVWVNPFEIPGNGIDDDGNGYIDDVHGIDVVNGDTDPMDDFGHGTHVAGTIGAVGNNSLGVVGVNWNVKILPCKFLDAAGSGSIADAVTCLEYARDLKLNHGINIVATNNSYGGLGAFSQTMLDSIKAQRDAGILFVAAAGNFGLDNDTAEFYPADFDAPNVIAVAATDHNDSMPAFSDFGRRSVHIGAPGVAIWSTVNFNFYTSANGTSMASPHVAGLAALLKAQDPTRDWRSIKNLVLSGGDPKPSLTGKTISGRRLNAFNAVSCANRPLFSVVKIPAAFTVGVPSTVSALSINCGNPVGPVTATSSAGETFTLLDGGIAPDQAAGDGIFTATWTPTRAFTFIDFASAAGSERIAADDLAVNAVSGPAGANRGDVVALSATVANVGTSAAPASTVNFYLSTDAIITTADTLVGSVATSALAAGAQQVVGANVTIPSTIATGTYFVGAIVDPANTIDEGNETNNAKAGNAIVVSNIAVDLSVTAVSGPTTGNTGNPIAVSATVQNLGTSAAAATTLKFYLSSDAVIGSTDTLLATLAVPALAGGASTIISASPPIPVTLPPGTYFIGAIVDPDNAIIETNEANNSRAGNTIVTSTQAVDLTMTAVSGPTTARNEQSITLSATVSNQGTASAPASMIRWYLSTDSTITTADTPLGSVTTTTLAAGASRTVSITTTVPASVPAGTYRFGVIADPDNLVAETNETNNARASGSTVAVSYTADLVMTAVAGPPSAATGTNVTFTGTLKNQGAAAVNQSFNVGFYLSSDSTITTNDRLVATVPVASLAAGESIPLSVTVTLRTSLQAGTYRVGAIADDGGVIAESNNNNNALAGNTIVVTIGPDLVMTAVAGPTTATRGQTVTLTGTVKNQGVGAYGALSDLDGPPNTIVRVGFYLSTNTNITANDQRIGSVSLTQILAGASIPLSVSATIPSTLALGTYYIGAIADDTGALRESNEGNNALPGNQISIR